MRSAVRRGAIGADRIAAFKRTVRTVAGDLAGDMRAVLEGRQSREEFMSRYGHLRPGTYDILSPRYAARGDLFADCHLPDSETHVEPFVPTNREERALATLLREAGFDSFVPADMFEYARRAIQGREYAKFVFSWNVSAVLEALARWGSLLAMERDDVSFLTLDEILATGLVSPPRHGTDRIADLVRASRSEWTSNRAVKLSYLIRTESDVLVVPLHRSAPNFITTRNIEGNIVHLDDADTITNVHDRIVCIASADPGFDWLFAKGIRGLITQYGGANSHMAIRCAEFGLPAAIGIGEETFKRIVKAKAARLNCGTRIVGPLYDHHGP
jgi:phosphohistidine swiveling domain-containing protein